MLSWNWQRVSRRLPILLVPALLAFVLGKATAQTPATLALDEAIRLAKGNNPAFRMQSNDVIVADWGVAESIANLLPSVSVGGGLRYQPAGKAQGFGAFTAEDLGLGETPPVYFSSYGLNMSLGLSGQTFFQIAQQKANRAAADATLSAAEYNLVADVTREYLTALRSKEGVTLAQKDLTSAKESQKLAAARFSVGEGTKIDVAQADVAVGRAEVALIQAENLHETDKLRLLQRLGVNLDRDIELTTRLELFEPTWTREQLTQMALRSHPQLQAARASENAGRAAARAAKTAYLPSLQLSAGWGGTAREQSLSNEEIIADTRGDIENQRSSCETSNKLGALIGRAPQDCTRFVYSDELGQRAIANNNVFPFNFTSYTPSFTLSVNVPIFDGLTRERQLQQARATAEDAQLLRRQTELAQQTAVATAHLNVLTAHRSVSIEQRNAETAAVQLELARERYRLGAGTFVDLSTAEAVKARADRDYVNAVYTFHENVAALEAAVGQRLR